MGADISEEGVAIVECPDCYGDGGPCDVCSGFGFLVFPDEPDAADTSTEATAPPSAE